MGREKWGYKSGATKVGREKWGEKNWGEKSVATFLVPQSGEKSWTRKVGQEKWGERSGARKVGREKRCEVRKVRREKWGEKSEETFLAPLFSPPS